MSRPAPGLVGVILVGGRSTRMGQDKASLRLADGRTFAAAVAATLDQVSARTVTVGESNRPALELPSDVVHLDDAEGAGPLAGVAAALFSGLGERYLVASCDAPLIEAQDLEVLLDLGGPAAAFGEQASWLQPLPCVLSAGVKGLAKERMARGERSLQGFLQAAGVHTAPADDDRLGRLRGVNTPEELSALTDEQS